MDNLQYGYNKDGNGNIANNKLRHVKDDLSLTNNYTEDIDNQPDDNYGYDAIGNLIKDSTEKITNINWSVYGKILDINKTTTTTGQVKNIHYTYDASGNRISKIIDRQGTALNDTTWYVRDATGNVMAVYNTNNSISPGNSIFNLTEHHLYGSSRLGIFNRSINADSITTGANANLVGTTYLTNFTRGYKFFELSNHLQNVLVTISDKKIGVDQNNDGIIDYYTADIQSANDYYPGGMEMPGRIFNAGSYAYGFNGKRKDNEIKGEGNSYDFGERIYDPRVSRWLSIDPLFREYPHQSPYVSMSNDPINRIDPTGMGDYYGKDGTHLGSDGKTITVGKGKKAKQVSDDKAYVAESVVLGKNGLVTSAVNSKELSVSNSTLGKFANAIARESSGDMEESYALGSAIVNLANYKGKDVLGTLKTQGIFGYNGNTNFTNSESSIGAAINALSGGTDYSNGAIRWDGFDLAARGFDHPKPRKETGVEISETHFNAFKSAWPDATIKAFSGGTYTSFSSNFSSGIHVATEGDNAGRCLFKSTAVHGRTMFWGVNKDPIMIKITPWRFPMALPSSYPTYNPFSFWQNSAPSMIKESIHVNAGFKNWKGL
jgi:RHS repeat-associated protein